MFDFYQIMFRIPVMAMKANLELMKQSIAGMESLIDQTVNQVGGMIEDAGSGFLCKSGSDNSSKEAEMSYAFSDNNVTTVQYQILFVRRDFESIFQDTQTVVTQNMSGDGFVAWRIANFVELMSTVGVPLNPSALVNMIKLAELDGGVVIEDGRLIRLSPDNNQYLRVEYQVLSEIAREEANYEEEQTEALQEIARALRSKC